MDISINEVQPRVFSTEHFASEYERYAALSLTRIPRVGRAAVAQLLADWERRTLLVLPARAPEFNHYRLDASEIDPVIEALAVRESELLAQGEFDAPVFRNVEILGAQLGLNAAERALLAFAVTVESLRLLRDAMERLSSHMRDRPTLVRGLAALLGRDAAAVRAALAPDAMLARTGLLRIELQNEDGLLLRAREGLAPILLDEFDARDALFSRFAAPARATCLSADDFSHLAADRDLLIELLRKAAAQREAGINVMLYGAPGTGKTELARVVAAAAGLTLHEVRHTDDSGDDMRRARYSQVVVAQQLLQPVSDAVLLFDETEDLLPADASSAKALGKAAFNHMLESNQTPMIWVSNEITQIDPAYLRRFACVLEVKKPNRTVRRRIAARAFGALDVREDWLERIADIEDPSPGQITQAARVARLLSARVPAESQAVAERVLGHGMRALGQRRHAPDFSAARFDLSLLNCGADVHALLRNIARQPSARLAFYGPPGTGKSALARHLAQVADRPLLVKRASDLLSPWVGECEQNIARAFEQAADENALLLLDEADSFLCDRRDARARWELTETSELLTQMEQFSGIFVCTTNLMDRLDRAALRRFSLKLRFDYLTPEQMRLLLLVTLKALGAETTCKVSFAEVSRLICATPGDFSAVEQRFRLLGERPAPVQFMAALREELVFKQEGGAQRMGF